MPAVNRKICFHFFLITSTTLLVLGSCRKEVLPNESDQPTAIETTFKGSIDISNPLNYAAQFVPGYITKSNGMSNPVSDKGATLGRVMFYDKQLSVNNTISCGSCHQQGFAFGDTAVASTGVNGKTGRHSMRLVNARFGQEAKFF